MKQPFLKKNELTLYNADCRSAISLLGDGNVDMVFADPPFNLDKEYEQGENGWKDEAEYYDWCSQWIRTGWELLRPGGTFWLMTIQKHLNRMWTELDKGGSFRKLIIWKNSSMPIKDNFCTVFQPILYFVKPPEDECVFNYGFETRVSSAVLPWGRENKSHSITDIWDDIPFISGGCMASKEAILIPGTKKKAHDCQMPMSLARRMVGYTTNEGDSVVDMFCGSGTVPEACWMLGRGCTAFEDKERHCELISGRMEANWGEDSFLEV